MEKSPRRSGILLHITSLPGAFGIGDLGPTAHEWIKMLAKSGQRSWQMLPLHPPEAGQSPYGALSVFAGNPLLISPEMLVQDGWITRAALPERIPDSERVDYAKARTIRERIFGLAYEKFRSHGNRGQKGDFEKFRRQQSGWLEDFALFMAMRERRPGVPWQKWGAGLVKRKTGDLASARRELAEQMDRHRFIQFLFFEQLRRLREHAEEKEIELIGDMPIFLSLQSADVWTNPHLFQMDEKLNPTASSGVPPDAFSTSGQSWGNPLYNWRAMEREKFAWWIQRMRGELKMAEVVRLDHFRGFEAYWRIPAGKSARQGEWVKAPGEALFSALCEKFKNLPFIAEDLGMITEEVEELRDRFKLPGMRVLHFAFSGEPENVYLPHNYTGRSVAYTGTHDNDTTAAWFKKLNKSQRKALQQYLPGIRQTNASWELIEYAWASVADRAIAPMQDVLNLGGYARMNRPGGTRGNWLWRIRNFSDCREPMEKLRNLTEKFARTAS